ncbi:MAG: MobQ family relaxase [Cyanobacteria bacterium P01_H01_bin.152]
MPAAIGYYLCSVRPLGRSTGASATAAAAYRAGERIHDDRTGLTHDYQRRTGVEATAIVMPETASWHMERTELWNTAEQAERKCNARVAREAIIAFPHQLSESERLRTGHELGQWLANEYQVAVDIAWHRPDKRGDQRNHHAHVLFTTREVTADGLGKKTRVLDSVKTGPEEVSKIRQRWAEIVNAGLVRSQTDVRVDHRSYKDQGLEIKPGIHLGRQTVTLERQGIKTTLGDVNRQVQADNDTIIGLHHQLAVLQRQLAEAKADEQRLQVQAQAATAQDMAQHTKDDRTRTALQRQLQGMGAECYDIGVLLPAANKDERKMVRRFWSTEELLDRNSPKLAWLKRQNSQGADIYVRPDPRGGRNSGLILVDDLDLRQLKQLEQNGLKPAVIAQTSPDNFQAWVKLSEHPLEPEVASEAGRVLAERYGGDPASIDWQHYGRLAGFTNRKGTHTQANGRQPYVLLESYHGKVAPQATPVLQEAQRRLLKKQQAQQAALARMQAEQQGSSTANSPASATENQRALKWFLDQRPQYERQIGRDGSRVDWHQCLALHRAGYSKAAVAYALQQGRPDMEAKKSGHIDDYVTRTVEKSWQWVESEKTQSAPTQSAAAGKGQAKPAESKAKESERSLEDQRALIEQWQQLRDDQERSRERAQAPEPPSARSEKSPPNPKSSDPNRLHQVRTANVLYTYDFENEGKQSPQSDQERDRER